MTASGGSTSLPCVHYPRTRETILNRVLLAGTSLAAKVSTDVHLKRHLRKLGKALELSSVAQKLTSHMLDEAWLAIDRRTGAYRSAINLIGLLFEGTGISMDGDSRQPYELPGFLFDMNSFFQKLLSKFLRQNIKEYSVIDEKSIVGMFSYTKATKLNKRRDPSPRPDYVVQDGNKTVQILDAKYRDVWDRGLPREMLYQLTIYALSRIDQSFNTGQAVLLYPTLDTLAREQIIDIRAPSNPETKVAEVIIRPVQLLRLEKLVSTPVTRYSQDQRREFANELVFGLEHGVQTGKHGMV